MIYPTEQTDSALMLLAGTRGLLLQLGNVLEAGDCEQHTAASVIANAQGQLGSAASLLQADPDSAAACLDSDPMRGELASLAAAFDALGLAYTGQADRMNPHAEMALLWGLHQHLSTLGTALHSRPIFMEGQP